MITFYFVPCYAQESTTMINSKDAIYKDIDGKIISSEKFLKISKDGKYEFIIKDLGKGKKEVRLGKKANSKMAFKEKDFICKDIDGKIISSEEMDKISKDGKYTFTVKDLENGKKEIRLVKKDNSKIAFNEKDVIYKDIDGKIISSEEMDKISKDGKYTFTVKDLGKGKKEIRLVKK